MGNQDLGNRNLKYGNGLTGMEINLAITLMPFACLQWQAKVTWNSSFYLKALEITVCRSQQRLFLSGTLLPSVEEIKVPKLHVQRG